MITKESVYGRILDYANRANPYPLYAQLRETPVARQEDGSYVVSTYREIVALLHDPRISTDARNFGDESARGGAQDPHSFIGLDPPEHDRLRSMAMRHFGPPDDPGLIDGMRPEFGRIVTGLIDRMRGRSHIDIVDDFAYPFPVTVICEILGVPREDEGRFHEWADAIIQGLDPRPERRAGIERAQAEMSEYMADLIERFRRQPGEGLLSAVAADDGPLGRMTTDEMVSTGRLLLIAGHETTVNLITNGMLTLLRHPDVLGRFRVDPDLAVPLVEELLRYEPPVQLLPLFTPLDDVVVAGTTIPRGAPVTIALAAANRDPERFADPDRFDPDRRDNQHLGFNTGIHYCFGAPLARLEVQIALTELTRRLQNPRLVEDPPEYRQSPSLRGPRHLPLEIAGVSG